MNVKKAKEESIDNDSKTINRTKWLLSEQSVHSINTRYVLIRIYSLRLSAHFASASRIRKIQSIVLQLLLMNSFSHPVY